MKDFELNAYNNCQKRISFYVHLNIIIYLLLFLPSNLTLNTFQIIVNPCMSLSYTVVTRHEHIIIYPYISRLTSWLACCIHAKKVAI